MKKKTKLEVAIEIERATIVAYLRSFGTVFDTPARSVERGVHLEHKNACARRFGSGDSGRCDCHLSRVGVAP